ncbi:efflux RND transporter permease subunit [cf. Phormidesmis sp. LEGE 11477]|uniref:efflux RND transporter permease subunit n=1 Tax=cf. Phormidesmis sp. LEGE 11477 TaxID=1828680 RepID=UPI00187E0B2B|nr:efflux RND transporter permease subunit [cf. Phormidesmis sp. LEGE 11477]MBE9060582.1 efflux RND transporter permease subunit [cf. Phormidesmis sp. LEGE 11477]
MTQPSFPPNAPSPNSSPNSIPDPTTRLNRSGAATESAGGFSLSRLAIRRHIATLMLTVAVIVLGLFFVRSLPVDLLPSITYPRIGVRADAPGVSPEVAVDEVTRPLEQALAATEGVVQVVSQTREGRISLDLYFQPGGNIDQALNDATATLNRARSSLPETIGQPRLFKFDPSQLPVYEIALTSDSLRRVDLRVFAEQELSRELNTVPGVASADVSGGVSEEIRINLDPARLQSLGLGINEVLDALSERNQDTSGGRIEGPNDEPLTRVAGRFENADEIRNLIFEVGDEAAPQQVYLRDFAEVIDGTEEQRIFVNLNGQPAVKVSVQKQPTANTITVVEGIKQKLMELEASGLVPADLVINATLDESVFVQNAVRNVAISGLTGAGLAAIAVLLFLGSLRQTFIIVIAIPLATLVAILTMGIFGLSLNVFSLGGLALGVGIVVDNAIVMLENITKGVEARHEANDRKNNRKGAGRKNNRAVIRQAEVSSRELESALFASTTTNLVAVLPFLLIGGFISLLFNELVLTVSFAVAASLVVALTVVPALTARLLAVPQSSGINRFWLIRQFDRHLQSATQRYAQWLGWVLQRRILTIAIAFSLLGGGSLLAVQQIPQEILPSIATGQADLWAQFPPGTTLEENRQVMNAIDELLLAQPEAEYVFSTAGGFLFGNSSSENALRGTSKLTLVPGTNVQAFCDRLNQEFQQFNLVNTRLRLFPGRVRGLILGNSPVRSDVDVILQGSSASDLETAGQQVLEALDAQATLASYSPDADPPQPEVQIRPDWERAADLDLSAEAIGRTVQTVLSGSVPTQIQRGDRLVDVRVQTPDKLVRNLGELAQLPLLNGDAQAVRLGDIARIEAGQAPGEIQRIGQRQVFIIEGDLAEDISLGEALAELDQIMATVSLPDGVTRLPSFSAQSNADIQDGLGILGGLAAFLVFTVMAVQYNSLVDPLIIMLTVPLALAGGIFGLFITQTAIGATVVVGAVLLVGIVVNNAIILVELANQIYAEEKGVSEASPAENRLSAICKAAPQRLRPILMTTITTVLGMFPLALGIGQGSEFLQPLGVVVFSGLSLATLLTLFIIPCFYTLFHGQWRAAK